MLKRFFRIKNASAPQSIVEAQDADTDQFDPSFYMYYYADIRNLIASKDVRKHYIEHGRREGRLANSNALIEQLVGKYGPLPTDFEPYIYRLINKDLSRIEKDWDLTAHYIKFGRSENRKYKIENENLEHEYRIYISALRGKGKNLALNTEQDSFSAVLARHKLTPGAWLDRFNLNDFAYLNADWLDRPPASRMEAILVFVERGIQRIAPISMKMIFDPTFYREIFPETSRALDDQDLYRLWLNENLHNPGNRTQFLRELIGSGSYPECFDGRAYARVAKVQDNGRDRLLMTFFQKANLTGSEAFITGPGAARLYENFGEYHLRKSNAAIAKEAFDRALKLDPGNGRCRHRRGDALRLLGSHRDSISDFLAAVEHPNANLWSHIHAVDGLATTLEQPEVAVELLLRSAPTCHGSADWRAVAHRVLTLFFEKECQMARAFYVAGCRAEGDRRTSACLTRLETIIRAIDPLPNALPVPADGPIVIIANRDLPQCDHYRVVQKYQLLIEGGWEAEIFDQRHIDAYRPALDRARLVIFYRVAASPVILHALLYARALGVPTLYEIDDVIFDAAVYPDPFESFEGQIDALEYASLQQGVPLFRHAIGLCDAGLASTPALAETMRPLVRTGTCHLLRNGLDERNDRFLAIPWRPFSPEVVTIFYGSGTKAHNRDFTDFAAPALLDAMTRHPHVRLVVAGHLHLDARFDRLLERVHRLGFVEDVEAYWEVLSGADINLAVLTPSATTDAKSEIKWLEAAMCAVPSVVSPTRTYREILRDGEDVLFADTPEAWSKALERLVGDPALRRRIGERARERALAAYASDVAIESMAEFLPPRRLSPTRRARPRRPAAWPREVERPAAPASARRARILFVNVFFPPQIHGGATRVLRDNVDFLVETASERFECAVVASDDGVEPAYRTRIDAYGGIPVYRISSPRMAHMDWRPFDPSMDQPFERILRRFKPDLVHFHCIQRLTGTVVETVRALGIPYVVTLHDAWWISDYQFLITPDGVPQAPGPDGLAQTTDEEHGRIISIARRRRLGRLLDDAEALVTVSESFAALYRSAGHPNVLPIPNGVSNFDPLPRTPNPAGRVRLGHIGNRSDHKGANLVEAVLRATPFSNLSLTMIDYTLSSDTVCEEVWGTTPVRLVGPTPQEKIAELYAGLDVLIAPSLWPESFGLVTREARAAHLWVVASDRGAIGEDIADGMDGFRIDVSSLDGLRRVLSVIDAKPDRYLVPPPHARGVLRTSRDQGQDLIELYDRILDPIPQRAAAVQRA